MRDGVREGVGQAEAPPPAGAGNVCSGLKLGCAGSLRPEGRGDPPRPQPLSLPTVDRPGQRPRADEERGSVAEAWGPPADVSVGSAGSSGSWVRLFLGRQVREWRSGRQCFRAPVPQPLGRTRAFRMTPPCPFPPSQEAGTQPTLPCGVLWGDFSLLEMGPEGGLGRISPPPHPAGRRARGRAQPPLCVRTAESQVGPSTEAGRVFTLARFWTLAGQPWPGSRPHACCLDPRVGGLSRHASVSLPDLGTVASRGSVHHVSPVVPSTVPATALHPV